MRQEFIKRNLGRASFGILLLWFSYFFYTGDFSIEYGQIYEVLESDYDIDISAMHDQQNREHNEGVLDREETIPDYLIPPPPHIPIDFAPIKIAPIGAMPKQQPPKPYQQVQIVKKQELQKSENKSTEPQIDKPSRDSFTNCKPGQKYSDVEPYVNKNWMLELSRDKYSAKEMHELLIHRLSEEEKDDWICKIFGTRLEEQEQENKEEEVKISFHYKGNFLKEYLKDDSFDENLVRYKVKGFGHKMCGNCVFTAKNEEADALIIDNGPLLQYQKSFKTDIAPPSVKNRNLSQYWVFANYESASKNVEEQAFLMPEELDGGFNMTYSYRRDSDIVRDFGSTQNILRDFYFDWVTGDSLNQTDIQIMAKLIGNKNQLKGKADTQQLHTVWHLANCNDTLGSRYGKEMIEAGLEAHLNTEGACFKNDRESKPRTFDSIVRDRVQNHFTFTLK